MKTLCIGCSWILKYVIGEILLQDSDDYEQEFVIYDQTQTVEEFFIFPPISRYAGDERLTFVPDIPTDPFDCVIIDTNILEDVQKIIDRITEQRVILLSSWEVYGFQGRRQIPFDEKTTSVNPTSNIGKTKEAEETLVTPLSNVCILRLSNIYGPYMPEDSEIITWLTKMLNDEEIIVDQPASRFYDLNYVTNCIGAIQAAMTADLKGEWIFNIGCAETDYREENKGKRQVNVFEQNVVNLLVGLRHLIASTAPIRISDEDLDKFQGKGFHSQLKTERARKILDYPPNNYVPNVRGMQQMAYWLQKTVGVTGAPDLEITYPTLTEDGMRKIGLDPDSRKKLKDIERLKVKEVDESLLCGVCNHQPSQVKQFLLGEGDKSYECKCECHNSYREET